LLVQSFSTIKHPNKIILPNENLKYDTKELSTRQVYETGNWKKKKNEIDKQNK
jgi:hypothetical protein